MRQLHLNRIVFCSASILSFMYASGQNGDNEKVIRHPQMDSCIQMANELRQQFINTQYKDSVLFIQATNAYNICLGYDSLDKNVNYYMYVLYTNYAYSKFLLLHDSSSIPDIKRVEIESSEWLLKSLPYKRRWNQ